MSKIDIAAIDALVPDGRGGGSKLTDDQWRAVKRARTRGVSWATLHATLGVYSSPGSLGIAYRKWLEGPTK